MFQVLRKVPCVFKICFSSMARKVVEKPRIAHLLPFSRKQNWFPFCLVFSDPFTTTWSREEGDISPNSVNFTDLSAAGIRAVCASLEAELSS